MTKRGREGEGKGRKRGERRRRVGKGRILSSSAHYSVHLRMLFHILFETLEDTDLIREENQEQVISMVHFKVKKSVADATQHNMDGILF